MVEQHAPKFRAQRASIRRADAVQATLAPADIERPLARKGERQARRMAQWLNHHLPDSTQVLTSPAVRARQMAEALGRKFKTVPALAPGESVPALPHASRWPDARAPVLVVGHQDTLGLAAATLLAGEPQPWSVRKGAIWWLRQHERDGAVVLLAVLSPQRI